jgi:hypothetical protein
MVPEAPALLHLHAFWHAGGGGAAGGVMSDDDFNTPSTTKKTGKV